MYKSHISRRTVLRTQFKITVVVNSVVLYLVIVSFSLFILCYYAPVLVVVNLCFYFFVFIPALVLPFYSINYVCMYE